MNIGQRIKSRRKELKISAEELGKKLGKDRSTIYRYEKGDIENLPLDILEPIAQALSTTPQYLMGWEKEQKKNDTLADIVVRMRNDQVLFEATSKLAEQDDEALAYAMKVLEDPELLKTAALLSDLDDEKKMGVKTLLAAFLK